MSPLNFNALRDLHNSANDLLNLPVIKRALVHNQQEKWVDKISEASLRMLDVCGTTKDILLLVKDHLQQLQSTFRKVSTGETAIENKFGAFYIHRKKLKKEMSKQLRSLKGMKNNFIVDSDEISTINDNLMVVVAVLREVRVTTACVLESLMSLMSMPSPIRKPKRGLLASKLMRVNSLLLWEKCDLTSLQSGNKILEGVEIAIEELEVELECIFRRLIRTRVTLLNILTN